MAVGAVGVFDSFFMKSSTCIDGSRDVFCLRARNVCLVVVVNIPIIFGFLLAVPVALSSADLLALISSSGTGLSSISKSYGIGSSSNASSESAGGNGAGMLVHMDVIR